MKYLVATVVVVVLFILPIGSWYYLSTGLDYRMDALELLKPKGKIKVDTQSSNALNRKTAFIVTKKVGDHTLNDIYSQYGSQKSFLLLTNQQPNAEVPNWKMMTPDLLNLLKDNYPEAGIILTDTSQMVRNIYSIDPDDFKLAIEHTAIVLPRLKELDVKMRN